MRVGLLKNRSLQVRGLTLAASLLLKGSVLWLAAPAHASPDTGPLSIDTPETLHWDDPLSWRVGGADPGETVRVELNFSDDAGVRWASSVTCRADADGALASGCDALASSSAAAAADELLAALDIADVAAAERIVADSAELPPARAAYLRGRPYLSSDGEAQFALHASGERGESATAEFTRIRFAGSVREQRVDDGGIAGVLFSPTDPQAAILLLPGSTGGVQRDQAAALARHGYAVLSLGYFNYPGRPDFQAELPLEYFRDALLWLHRQTGEDRAFVQGVSRGAEASLAIAAYFPELVRGVVAVAPLELQMGAFDGKSSTAPGWTLEGQPLPYAGTAADVQRLLALFPKPPPPGPAVSMRSQIAVLHNDPEAIRRASIPVEKIQVPMLLLAGDDDQLWPADVAVQRIVSQLAEKGTPTIEAHVFEDAGHNLLPVGYPTTRNSVVTHPVTGQKLLVGGTPEGNAKAQRQSWNAVLNFYAQHTAASP